MLLAVPVSAASAQSAFVHVLRGDTIQIEKFTRTPARIDGEVTARAGMRQVYSNVIRSDGQLGALTLTAYSPGARSDAPPMMTATLSLTGDTAVAILTMQGQPSQTQRIPSVADANPILNASIAVFEVLIQGARRGGATSATRQLFLSAGGKTYPAVLGGLTSDSVFTTIAGQAFFFITDSAGRVIRAGLPGQPLTVTRVDGIAVSKIGFAKPDYSAPAGAPYTAEEVTVPTTFRHTLGGTFTKPADAAARLPVVITITGSGAQDRDEHISLVPGGYRPFRQLADTLARRGIATLRMDDRGFGASGGSFAAATSADFAKDVGAAIAYLRVRPDIDPRKIFLAGHSEGGLVAPIVAASDPLLAGIVLMAGPGRTGRAILEFQVRYSIERDSSLTAAKRADSLTRVPKMVDSVLKTTPWLTFFGTHDPIATAKGVKTPVLILQGGDDQQVIAAEAPLLANAFRAGGNADVTAQVFPQLNHLFILQPGGNPAGYATLTTNLASPAVLGMAVDWVVERAKRPALR